MRESKVVTVTQKIERKQTTTAKGLNTVQSLPRGMECIDPLGVGYIILICSSNNLPKR